MLTREEAKDTDAENTPLPMTADHGVREKVDVNVKGVVASK